MSYKYYFLTNILILIGLFWFIYNNIQILLNLDINTYNENKFLILTDFILTHLLYFNVCNSHFIRIYYLLKNFNQEFVYDDLVKQCDQSSFGKFNIFLSKFVFYFIIIFDIFFNQFIFGCQTKYQCNHTFFGSILITLLCFLVGLGYYFHFSKLITNLSEKYLLYENVKIFTPKNSQECGICLEENCEKFSELKCGHAFHHFCFDTYAKNKDLIKCPICNQSVNSDEISNLTIV